MPIPIQPLPDAKGVPFSERNAKVIKIYPRSVVGVFARLRWLSVWLTQLVFYGLPWLQWNQRQAVLFDLSQRRFYVFGLVLQPQDLIYLAALLIIAALALFFFTAIAGRVWCGYACPQTVYTEIFLWVERHTEGDRQARMRLDQAPWSLGKLARKAAKQSSWIAIGLLTGLSFVGYFTPMRSLVAELATLAFSPWEWFWVLFYAFATYGNAGYMREQVCKQMCPYARFQSALIDMDSLVIAYDAQRGEHRGARGRKADPRALGLGDCIDCTLCVQVCPTGIDIRNGLQNECIACAACIDVCDQVMLKMDYAPGLIRYSSGNGMLHKLDARQMVKRVGRPRVWIYGFLLLLVGGVFVTSLSLRKGFVVDVMKDRGSLAREVAMGSIENVYRIQVMNGLEQRQSYVLSAAGLPELALSAPTQLTLDANGIGSLVVRLTLPQAVAEQYRGSSVPIFFDVKAQIDGKEVIRHEKSVFYIPR